MRVMGILDRMQRRLEDGVGAAEVGDDAGADGGGGGALCPDGCCRTLSLFVRRII